MPGLFKRKCLVIVYSDRMTSFELVGDLSQAQEPGGLERINRYEIKSLDLSDLRIQFEIDKDLSNFANLAKISIYNLSVKKRGLISREFQRIIVSVGYGEGELDEGVSVIFDGTIRNIFHRRERTNIISEIFAADGDPFLREGIFSRTTEASKDALDLILETADQFKDKDGNSVARGEINIGIDGTKPRILIKGRAFTSQTAKVMTELAITYDFDWFIDNGKFYALSSGRVFESQKTTVLTSISGMIESPVITERGIDVQSLLNADISPGRKLVVKSVGQQIRLNNLYFDEVAETLGVGQYKVSKVLHIGDTRGKDWHSNIEALRY